MISSSPSSPSSQTYIAPTYDVFGSFFTEDVDTLILQKNTRPSYPFDMEKMLKKYTINSNINKIDNKEKRKEEKEEKEGENVQYKSYLTFGKKIHDSHFMLSPEWTFINHGAFGSPFRYSFDVAQEWRIYCEKQPLRFLDRELFPLIIDATQQLSELIGVQPQDLVFVANASEALNTILRYLLIDNTVISYDNYKYENNNDSIMKKERIKEAYDEKRRGNEKNKDKKEEIEGDKRFCDIKREIKRNKVTVLHLSTVYGATKKVLNHFKSKWSHVEIVQVVLNMPPKGGEKEGKDYILDLVVKTIDSFNHDEIEKRKKEREEREEEKERKIDIAIFDHITSSTALIMPIEDLVRECRIRGIITVVDGAHSLAYFPHLNVTSIDADFYFGNCHKWFCNTRGCGFMCIRGGKVKKERQCLSTKEKEDTSLITHIQGQGRYADFHRDISPLVLSHGTGRLLTSNFIWSGNRDYSNVLALVATIRLWKELGGFIPAIKYSRELCKWAGKMLVEKWKTELLVPFEWNMSGSMCLIRIPSSLIRKTLYPIMKVTETKKERKEYIEATGRHADVLQDLLHFKYLIEVPIKCISGSLYVRISCHIYNCKEDYIKLEEAISDCC